MIQMLETGVAAIAVILAVVLGVTKIIDMIREFRRKGSEWDQ